MKLPHYLVSGLLGAWLLAACSHAENPSNRPLPGLVASQDIADYKQFSAAQKKLVDTSLSEAKELKLNSYVYASADPSKGGFDCSGSIFYLLKQCGYQPPRSSSAQYEWLKSAGEIHSVPAGTSSLDDPAFADLQPGDLLFWSGTYSPKDKRANKITHVQMYLGVEKARGKAIMIGSSDGRSYQGKARCGFGVFDFKLPSSKSKSKFVGYGSPPSS
ncbi:C40 family peptidase [Persicirhabdus sediminis]|uniref:C40 family peptidase n=1 Tax=Persicirhabdus sediminis TaxID=454144 RepID=A0A8J7SIX4_9BACT|nr:NlpC/P60 family protein [Persicirhabdus sediminis]MBK1791745.1 C40 family peptidase [Persicirhabdus sediminis]